MDRRLTIPPIKKLNIGKNVIIFRSTIIIVLVAIMALISCVLLVKSGTMVYGLTTDALANLNQMYIIKSNVADMEIAVLGAVTASSADDIKRLEEDALANVTETQRQYDDYKAILSAPEDKDSFEQLVTLKGTYEKTRDQVFKLLNDGKNANALVLYHSNVVPSYEAYARQIDKMTSWNHNDAKQTINSSADKIITTVIMIITFSMIIVFLCVGFAMVW